jgi:hypothetical protein
LVRKKNGNAWATTTIILAYRKYSIGLHLISDLISQTSKLTYAASIIGPKQICLCARAVY